MKKHDELPTEHDDKFVAILCRAIKVAIRVLAVLMVLVIFWGVIDVVYVMYEHLQLAPTLLLDTNDIFKTFAAFLVVLIAIEIFQNIVLYLRSDVIPMKLVLATALMAISRKVIIFDDISAMHILATSTVVLALGITYFLLDKKSK